MQNVVRYTCHVRNLIAANDVTDPNSSLLSDTVPSLLVRALSFICIESQQNSTMIDVSKLCGFPCQSLIKQAYRWVAAKVKSGRDKVSAEEFDFRAISIMIVADNTQEMAVAAAEMDYIGRSASLFCSLKLNMKRGLPQVICNPVSHLHGDVWHSRL